MLIILYLAIFFSSKRGKLPEKFATFAQKLLMWFSLNGRDFPWRRETDPYKILVAEKLLQQTTYGHVLKVYHNFFKKFPNARSLAKAEVPEIENAIRRLGFQRQRARQLKEIAQVIVNEYGGNVPSRKEDLLRLKGVGEYVANAVLCFAFGKDVAIVDMNVRRVVSRVFGWKGVSDKEIAKRLCAMLPKGKAKEFNWTMIDFSSIICSRKPKCKICFLNDLCLYYAQSRLGAV
jgi:A/G-specific adenine glycosylase